MDVHTMITLSAFTGAGVAMGLERLQMLHDKTDDIRNVITFTFEEGA